MAKSRNYEFVDKLARKARLAGAQRQHNVERNELKNMHRMGWQEFDQDEADEIDDMAGSVEKDTLPK